MDIKELRIGNYLVDYNGPLPAIIKVNIFILGEFNKTPLKDHLWLPSGIELTHDWITKLGFELEIVNEDCDPVYIIGGDGEYFYIDSDTLQPMDAGYPISKVKIEYVHQLQNLYYAITDKELTIK